MNNNMKSKCETDDEKRKFMNPSFKMTMMAQEIKMGLIQISKVAKILSSRNIKTINPQTTNQTKKIHHIVDERNVRVNIYTVYPKKIET